MLDGACRVADLAKRAEKLGMRAVACTDHGNMCAAIDLYKTACAHGLKPIIGCEFYVAPGDRRDRNPRDPHHQGYHLVLLAADRQGYRNLCRLNSAAWHEGFYYKPRIDKEILAAHSDGLLALSACLAGEIPASILKGDARQTARVLQEYLDIFGRDRFYLELQNHGISEQVPVNKGLTRLAAEYGVPLVATNDVHYLDQAHAEAHDILLCIGTQANVDDPNRLRFGAAEFSFKSAASMQALFPEHPEALRNTLDVAERCNLVLDLGAAAKSHYPVYTVAAGESRDELLRSTCLEGLRDRYGIDGTASDLGPDERVKVERMNYELDLIATSGFTSYFLVVWDFLRFAREQEIPVGPGRGSGAGSIVAYLTHITDIDPIRYGLLFERFLNPDRISAPDFDIDLCERRRQEVIEYVRQKYGADSVAQIGTFGTLKARQVLKDVARVMGRTFAEGNQITKLVPADPKMTLRRALKESPELRQFMSQEEWVRQVMAYSEILEGLNRNMSIHAAGVIIGDEPLTDLVPLAKGAADEVITQYAAGPCEDLGLLKLDFLGLRTLTIIRDSLDLIAATRGVHLVSAEIPLEDKATYELINKGSTIGVFQLESGGMRDLCRRFGVSRLEDIIALIALYRPGPMQFLDEFISRKTGETPVDYDTPELESLLRETYGIMLYQEQVMQVVQTVAGFSLGQADILRRAMGKKKTKEMLEQHGRFVAGCRSKGIDESKAEAIWDKIVRFAGYGFNKSHSAAYAMLSYRTAYLKANYPTDFMASVLSSELGNADKLAFFLKECAEMGIEVRPPDVNNSGLSFSVDGDCIRFGMAAVKGVGSAAAESIVAARGEGGPFTGLLDLCERIGAANVNRRAIESLCRAGALDAFGLRRAQVFSMIGDTMTRAQQTAHDRQIGQGSLFDFCQETAVNPLDMVPPDVPEWEPRELLGYEKELLGFYVTGHPIAEYQDVIDTYQIDALEELRDAPDQTGTRVAGILSQIDLKRSKRDNRPWAVVRLEGLAGQLECLVFADVYEANAEHMITDKPVFVEGSVARRDGDDTKLMADRIIPIEEVPENFVEEVHVHLHQASTDDNALDALLDVCRAHAGPTPLVFCLICATGEIAFVQPESITVCNSLSFREAVRDIVGDECLREKPNRARPEVKARRGRQRSGGGREQRAGSMRAAAANTAGA